jgi:hypothetical protein
MRACLPSELWQRVFELVAFAGKGGEEEEEAEEELPWAAFWVSGRQVCHVWRSCIAEVYLYTLLRTPENCLLFCITRDLSAEMTFDRLDSTDPSRCFFKASWTKWNVLLEGANETSLLIDFGKNMETYLKRADVLSMSLRIPHVLRLCGTGNDTEVPDLKYDVQRHEISFDWQGALQNFCVERCKINHRTAPAIRANLRLSVEKRSANDSIRDRICRDIRTERITKLYRERYSATSNTPRSNVDLDVELDRVVRINPPEILVYGKNLAVMRHYMRRCFS